VEKGGQAYKLRRTTTRTVKTCAPTLTGCTTLTDFTTGNTAITNTLLGVSAGERDAVINWARGLDLDDEHTDDGVTPSGITSTVMRPSVLGDVVHSRPVAINYGTDTVPQVVVFYGGNDGVLRAVNGNRTTSIGSVAAGMEFWSFMPPEFYPYINRLRSNTASIYYPSTPTTGATRKNYGFDGSMTSYVSTSAKYLYATMRRGGKAVYAFDVTNPASPSLKWKRGCDSSGCSTGFASIGQTWSTPKIITAAGYSSGSAPILVMGGGYDTCEDNDPHTCASPSGNKIYIMDANTGALLNTFTTSRSVVADTTAVTTSAGHASYLYTADLGGNIYRISGAANAPIGTVDPSLWVMTKIASLGCDTTASCTNNRKFMFAPDVVVDGVNNILLIGSGDREKPLTSFTNAASVTNYFFMLKDAPATTTWLSDEATNCSSDSVICVNSLASTTADGANLAQRAVDTKKGWRLQLGSTEQVVTSAITVFGVVTYSTHTPAVPTSGQCSNLGTAKVYNVGYQNANPSNSTRYSPVAGGGLPPSPVAGMVTLDDGSTVPFVIGADTSSALEVKPPPSPDTTTQPKARIFWNIVK
jgi:type IV pilus assembly protein PilY1